MDPTVGHNHSIAAFEKLVSLALDLHYIFSCDGLLIDDCISSK